MEDSDSGVGGSSSNSSIISGYFTASNRGPPSMSGDDKSTSGRSSRSSAASIPPTEVTATSTHLTVTSQSSPIRVWRDPQALSESQVRHIDSVQHHALMMSPTGQNSLSSSSSSSIHSVQQLSDHSVPIGSSALYQNPTDNQKYYQRIVAAATAGIPINPIPYFLSQRSVYGPSDLPKGVTSVPGGTIPLTRSYEYELPKLIESENYRDINSSSDNIKQKPKTVTEGNDTKGTVDRTMYRERREIENREMERHKEMEREREHQLHQQSIHQLHQQQQQQHQKTNHSVQNPKPQQPQHQQKHQHLITTNSEREKRERHEQCNTEEAVEEHFAASLRHANANQRSVWTLNTLPQQPTPTSNHKTPAQSGGPSAISLRTQQSSAPIPVTNNRDIMNRDYKNHFQRQIQQNIQEAMELTRQRISDRDRDREREQERQRLYYQQFEAAQRHQRPPSNNSTMARNEHPSAVQTSNNSAQPMVHPHSIDLNKHSQYANSTMYAFIPNFHKDHKLKQNDLGLPNPPPLMPDTKQSSAGVIVKHDTGHSKQPSMYSSSTAQSRDSGLKPNGMIKTTAPIPALHSQQATYDTYKTVGNIPHNNSVPPQPIHYDYRYKPPTQTLGMLSQPIYASSTSTASISSSQYVPPSTTLVQSKSKVSSPAPAHIYGKPTSGGNGTEGIVSGIPSNRPSSNDKPAVMKNSTAWKSAASPITSPFQKTKHQAYGNTSVMPVGRPPPAHTSQPPGEIYTSLDAKPIPFQIAATPSVSIYPYKSNSYIPSPTIPINTSLTDSEQMQPLDLGVSDRSSKRKSNTPIGTENEMPLDMKRRRTNSHSLSPSSNNSNQSMDNNRSSGQVHLSHSVTSIVGRPLPTSTNVIAPAALVQRNDAPKSIYLNTELSVQNIMKPSAATVVSVETPTSLVIGKPINSNSNNVIEEKPTMVANVNNTSTNNTVMLPINPQRTSSADGLQRPASTNSSCSAPSPGILSAPATPAKPLSSMESEKSLSPAPRIQSSGPRHLKKAWLQRHTGEDPEDTTGAVGSGNCVKLPITLTPPPSGDSVQQIKPMDISADKSVINNTNNAKKNNKSQSDNGHNSGDTDNKDDTSESDQEPASKNSSKRRLPKTKHKRENNQRKLENKKTKTNTLMSESEKENSESDKESLSDKDSDSGASTSQNMKRKSSSQKNAANGTSSSNNSSIKDAKEAPRKRGRRPKAAKEDNNKKKKREDRNSTPSPYRKKTVAQLKKTGESFLQDGSCTDVAPKLAKCRECRWTANQRSKNTPNIFCRFYAFRRLKYAKNGQLTIAGFSDPIHDPTDNDRKLWLPDDENPPKDLDMEMARFLLAQVADQFCDLLHQEKDAQEQNMNEDKTIAWKRVVQGVREMCDVCETTLFNYHWACGKCGFVVCIDCYKGRKNGTIKIWDDNNGKDRDEFSWLLCTTRSPHEQKKLMLTQIIAGNSLEVLGKRIHEARALWGIVQSCGCPLSKEQPPKATNGLCRDIIKSLLSSAKKTPYWIPSTFDIKIEKQDDDMGNGEIEDNKSALSWLAEVALQQTEPKTNGIKEENGSDGSLDKSGHSTLRKLLIQKGSPNNKNSSNGSRANSVSPTREVKKPSGENDCNQSKIIDEPMETTHVPTDQNFEDDLKKTVVQIKSNLPNNSSYMPERITCIVATQKIFPGVNHSWLCNGRLLRLIDPTNPDNENLFQEQWQSGLPVIISNITSQLDLSLWKPEAFSRDFGENKSDLVNCLNDNILTNMPMKKFWDGFENNNKRMKDEDGRPMLLKLKDWPNSDDFAEILPQRYADLMRALPMKNYTQRNGRLNLASRLPDSFVRPDLGPKMYNAYGSALHPTKGTTNLHLDISDAVNVMVYVGITNDGAEGDEEYIKKAYQAIDEAGCDILTKRRVREKGEVPGALWHIYPAQDADKIRDLLNKVAIEMGRTLEPNHDPIHDQSWYLDQELRARLYKEYDVEGYAITQCLGDAVFIPAGAPHQVRNLHNCIKVAEDFVSPENVSHCFRLTHEFRNLSGTHLNHEDKLQIKNIIYHGVKDALACLSHLLGRRISEGQGLYDVKN